MNLCWIAWGWKFAKKVKLKKIWDPLYNKIVGEKLMLWKLSVSSIDKLTINKECC